MLLVIGQRIRLLTERLGVRLSLPVSTLCFFAFLLRHKMGESVIATALVSHFDPQCTTRPPYIWILFSYTHRAVVAQLVNAFDSYIK